MRYIHLNAVVKTPQGMGPILLLNPIGCRCLPVMVGMECFLILSYKDHGDPRYVPHLLPSSNRPEW